MSFDNFDNRVVYNFDELVDRSGHGSIKWENAKRLFASYGDCGFGYSGLFAVSTADMDFRMAPEIVEALCGAASELVYGYTEPAAAYFDAVISWFSRRHGICIERDWLVFSPGVVSALCYAISAFTNIGDGVIVQTPVYRPFHASVKSLGRRVINNTLLFDGNNYRINFDDLESKASDSAAKMLILCNPHNPVGRVWKLEELERVADICNRHNVLVVSDEIHADIVFPPFCHASYLLLPPELRGKVIVCTSPSKSFNMCGLQVSNIIIPDGGVRLRFVRQSHDCGFHTLNCFAATATIAAYNKAEGWLDQLLKYIYANYELTKEFIESKIPQIKTCQLQGTYLQWLNFDAMGISGRERERLFRSKLGIFFESGYIFGEGGESFERLNLAYPKHFIIELLQRLKSIF
ncbi:MAG: pyridoxal phosphate-dependent aminotransferase [Planctomycetaceae bacterium]|jgi:putative C-S lyase|nr:pyridoxal phosphate-dependent aminotransferase [Planctomycetaceae bacterium]